MRILLVEDDSDLSATLHRGLYHTFTVDTVSSAQDALDYIHSYSYDLLVFDLTLPDGSGIHLCQKVRAEGYKQPILMLTASNTLADKVAALDAGADDFLSKPFHFLELQARLRALGRRPALQHHSTILSAGKLHLHLHSAIVWYGTQQLVLRHKERQLLELFLRYPGQVLTRERIVEKLWGSETSPQNNTVDVHVKLLRDQIEKPFRQKYIFTYRSVGYKFLIPTD